MKCRPRRDARRGEGKSNRSVLRQMRHCCWPLSTKMNKEEAGVSACGGPAARDGRQHRARCCGGAFSRSKFPGMSPRGDAVLAGHNLLLAIFHRGPYACSILQHVITDRYNNICSKGLAYYKITGFCGVCISLADRLRLGLRILSWCVKLLVNARSRR